MRRRCNKYIDVMPDITVYMNCDTRLAINLRWFDLGEDDEFIFVIKNYSYVGSPYAFIFRARKSDINEDGEVLFKISPEASQNIKPGAFYNFSVLLDAFNPKYETEYKKLTADGAIKIEYGAQDLGVDSGLAAGGADLDGFTIADVRLEAITDAIKHAQDSNGITGRLSLED